MNPDLTIPVIEHLLDSDELTALIRSSISDGHTISLNAPGKSMNPFIRSEDKIFISPVVEGSIQSGDILVFVHIPDNRVIAHRVVDVAGDRFLCKGDNVAERDDGWISFKDVLGRVDRVQRDGKPVRMGVESGKRLIAWLSLQHWLAPMMNILRRVKWGIMRLCSPEDKSKP